MVFAAPTMMPPEENSISLDFAAAFAVPFAAAAASLPPLPLLALPGREDRGRFGAGGSGRPLMRKAKRKKEKEKEKGKGVGEGGEGSGKKNPPEAVLLSLAQPVLTPFESISSRTGLLFPRAQEEGRPFSPPIFTRVRRLRHFASVQSRKGIAFGRALVLRAGRKSGEKKTRSKFNLAPKGRKGKEEEKKLPQMLPPSSSSDEGPAVARRERDFDRQEGNEGGGRAQAPPPRGYHSEEETEATTTADEPHAGGEDDDVNGSPPPLERALSHSELEELGFAAHLLLKISSSPIKRARVDLVSVGVFQFSPKERASPRVPFFRQCRRSGRRPLFGE